MDDRYRLRIRFGPSIPFLPNFNVVVRRFTTNDYRQVTGALAAISAVWPGFPVRVESVEAIEPEREATF